MWPLFLPLALKSIRTSGVGEEWKNGALVQRFALPADALPARALVDGVSGPDGVPTIVTDEATVLVGSQLLKIVACSAVRGTAE
jgi:hypothetical protein